MGQPERVVPLSIAEHVALRCAQSTAALIARFTRKEPLVCG